jgi:hypothetical protein
MGRNNTPTAILDARGSFIKHPERARPGDPTGTNRSRVSVEKQDKSALANFSARKTVSSEPESQTIQ